MAISLSARSREDLPRTAPMRLFQPAEVRFGSDRGDVGEVYHLLALEHARERDLMKGVPYGP